MEVGEGKAAAIESCGCAGAGVSWVKIQRCIVIPTMPEVHAGAVAVDKLFPPRVMEPPCPAPDATAEIAP